MSSETTPAVKLRQQTVTRIVGALICLSFGELIIIAGLIATHTPIPGELWLAFGGSTSALTALLVNTKVDLPPPPPPGGPGGPPLVVEGAPDGEPLPTKPEGPLAVVPVEPEAQPEEFPEEPPAEPVEAPKPRGRRR